MSLTLVPTLVILILTSLPTSVCVTSICRLVALKKISDSSDPTCKSLFPSHTTRDHTRTANININKTTTSAPPPGPPSNATWASSAPAYQPSVHWSHACYHVCSQPSAEPTASTPLISHTGMCPRIGAVRGETRQRRMCVCTM